LCYAVAETLADVHKAWQLVYDSYQRNGLIDANPFGVHTVPQAIGRNTIVVTGYCRDSTIGTLSAYADSPLGLPLDSVYPDELRQLRRAGRRLMEVGLFADRRDQVSRSIDALFELMRFSFYFASNVLADNVIVGVHPRHAPFYMRLFGFEQIGALRTYSTVKDRPVVLLRFDVSCGSLLHPLPKGIAYFLDHPVDNSIFASRYRFDDPAQPQSPIGQFLAARSIPNAA